MVALIVAMSIMAIVMTAVLPSWSQMARREKEAELVFRGEQYARAIGLFQRRAGPGVLPPSVDVLVQQKFLRKKYKDPITSDDFALLSAVTPPPPGAPGSGRGTGGDSTSAAGASRGSSQGSVSSITAANGSTVPGGIMGVTSKSTQESLRTYKGRTHYNEWQFVYVAQTQAAGASTAPAGQGRDGRGGSQQPGPAVPIGPGGRGGRGGDGLFRGGGAGGGRAQAPGAPPRTPPPVR